MKFKKIYVEITNRCNFSCSFCYRTVRRKNFISPEAFSAILFKIKPYTRYIYLHVLGEPLLHPQIEEILSLAHREGFFVNISTNGSLIAEKQTILQNQPVRQYNISLHGAEENIPEDRREEYFSFLFDFAKKQSAKSYFSFRLWNQGAETSRKFNEDCIAATNAFFGTTICAEQLEREKNIKIYDHIFLQSAVRFSWPGMGMGTGIEMQIQNRHPQTCYALRDHVAVLVDGSVVPCCLDADGRMVLGNIFQEDFYEIISSPRALTILTGFRRKKALENTCKDCGFSLRRLS